MTQCSSPVQLETQSALGAASPVLADTTVNLSSVPGTLTFYSNPACTTVITTVPITAGNSSAFVHFSASVAATYTLTAAATGLVSATQSATLINAPTQLVFTTTLPSPLLAGLCVLSTVQARRLGVASPVVADTPVGLTEALTGTARYYSDATCSTAVTTTTILAGQTNADFYLKPLTNGTTTQTATAPFGGASRALNIIGAVRRGNCAFANPVALADGGVVEDTFVTCTVSPTHQSTNRTALFFQATTSASSAGTADVRCRLTATNQIQCNRNGGTASGTVHWQTLELPLGMRVERIAGGCQSPQFNVSLPAAVNPATSFLLKSYETSSGDIDDEDLIRAQLVSSTSVALDFGDSNSACTGGNYDIQAVEMSGVAVTRGNEDGGVAIGVSSVPVTGLSATSLNAAMLSQHALPSLNAPSICATLLRSEMPTASSINFSRGSGFDGGCVVSPIFRMNWERIDFGARAKVQVKTVQLLAGSSTQAVPITAVDMSRTVVFASSQAASGQANGETSYTGGHLGDGTARFELTSTTNVNVLRNRSSGIATFTFYVVELDP